MRKKGSRRIALCLLLCLVFVCSSFSVCAEDEQIKISDKEYAIHLKDALSLFISNDKPVSGEVGSKVFLTYTVEKVSKNNAIQSGVIGTKDKTKEFPYLDSGRMFWQEGSLLYDEGYTYVFRFERTELGFEYHCAKMKDDKVETLRFSHATTAPESQDFSYYGTWIGGMSGEDVTATLNHVRCYDENGNDLGIHLGKPTATRQDVMDELYAIHPVIDGSYSFSLEDATNVAISNKYTTDCDTIYMEYEVENIKRDDTYQQGIIASSVPKEEYPHGATRGILLVDIYENTAEKTPLLYEGGQYFICINRKEEMFDAHIFCTVDGKTEMFTFQGKSGIYSPSFSYFSIWLGEGKDSGVSADFKNVKCYDADGKSLGIQLNNDTIPVSRKGSIEDYSDSQAVYYCEANGTIINLEDKQACVKDVEGVQEKGTYTIQGDKYLYLLVGEGKEHYVYETLRLIDESGNEYKRLYTSIVTFVTGEDTFEVKADASNGFRVEKPEAPVKEGHTFKGWYLGNETAYDFETVVTESVTLYAKWEDGDGNAYLAVATPERKVDYTMLVAIGISVAILMGSIVGSIVIAKRRKEGKK